MPASRPLLSLRGISKSFGATRAVREVDFAVREAEVVGLMGGNGAGKSTLMRIVGGLIAPDHGEVAFLDRRVESDHSPSQAMSLGIRFVHQELSLCPNLRVFENFALELPDLVRGLRWRSLAIARAREAMADVFPDNIIDPLARISSLSLSQQQMVEIARAASHPATRLLILDEPTSSLGSREAQQLRAYMRRRRADGLSFIFISHRLHETLDLADRIVVMRNGAVAWTGPAGTLDDHELLRLLGGSQAAPTEARTATEETRSGEVLVRLSEVRDRTLRGATMQLKRGEIVGLAGLEGSGQRELLRAIFARRQEGAGELVVKGSTAFVSGDRVAEGIFTLWPIDKNITLSSLPRVSRRGLISRDQERAHAATWFDRLKVRAASLATAITSLSGGNQQKVAIARALAADADILLLDDPTRGVDLGTKAEVYELLEAIAAEGRAILWYSTDDAEFACCNRTLVMCDGAIVAELAQDLSTPERIVEASFRSAGAARMDEEAQRHINSARKREALLPALIPLVTFVIILSLCVSQSPDILSRLGLTLVFSAAFALSFAAISQLFVITAGDIDLGLGAFIGLVNAIAATWLVTDPGWAWLCLAALLIAYPVIGLFIHVRRVPAIIVTLGLSFVWLGFAAYRLPRAGGAAPDWMVELMKVSFPLIPLPVFLCVFPGLVAYLILMVWRYGVVLRGFGGNPRAITAAGWSTHLAQMTLYGLAGLFAFLAGMIITASTRGGDPTGATSMTLLSVAAVILGGASFSGGLVAPISALFGTLTLVLVGTLLSLFEVSGLYLPMVQGLMLLGVVGLRTILVRRES